MSETIKLLEGLQASRKIFAKADTFKSKNSLPKSPELFPKRKDFSYTFLLIFDEKFYIWRGADWHSISGGSLQKREGSSPTKSEIPLSMRPFSLVSFNFIAWMVICGLKGVSDSPEIQQVALGISWTILYYFVKLRGACAYLFNGLNRDCLAFG